MRHAHMVNITPRIMTEGMRADFRTVDRISQRVIEKSGPRRRSARPTPAGTDITADLNPDYRWIKTERSDHAREVGQSPGGEVFTTPAT
jgi:leucyl aminopeptidase (aminopeptidase T)